MHHDQRLAWWRKARYGMFVHYGLCSVHQMGSTLFMCRYPQYRRDYFRFKEYFRANRFDADALARLAVAAGMKYIVLITKHHEGFALFGTKTTAYNAVQSPCGRDLVREFTTACRRHGLGVGLYFSGIDWSNPAYWRGPKKDPAGWRRFVDDVHEQVQELLTNYGTIDILWFDMFTPGTAAQWRARALYAMARRLQPAMLINNRLFGTRGDFDTPEREIRPTPRDWETCEILGETWGYMPWYSQQLRDPPTVVRDLLHCVAKGGNYLLNVNPAGDGSIPANQAAVLRRVGRWLKVNGASIYGTRRTLRGFGHGMVTIPADPRQKVFYLHVLTRNWYPKVFFGSYRVDIRRMSYLASGRPVPFRRLNGGYLLDNLPKNPPDPLDTVIKVEYHGKLKPLPYEQTFVPPLTTFMQDDP